MARALKRLETPVVASGLAGGRTGDRIVEDLGLEGILCDFVRISDESRTSIAVVDPTAGALTPAIRTHCATELSFATAAGLSGDMEGLLRDRLSPMLDCQCDGHVSRRLTLR